MLVDRVLPLVPHDVDLIVDISNMKGGDLRDLARAGFRRPLYVSTHKTFNAKTVERFPGTAYWLVICMPHAVGDDTLVGHFNAHKQRFDKSPSKSPTRVRYVQGQKPSKCIIERDRREMTSAKHAACEIDDLLIRQLALEMNVHVASYDTALFQAVEKRSKVHIDRQMRDLMDNSSVALLQSNTGRWKLRSSE